LQLGYLILIALDISSEFFPPKVEILRGRTRQSTTYMTMPKAAMNK